MRKNKGFTLIELLIVIAIIGLLATLALISLTTAQQRARDTKRVADMKSMQTAFELYYNEEGTYPRIASGAVDTWDELANVMSPYISRLPVAPNHSSTSSQEAYWYLTTNGAVDVTGDLKNDEVFYLRAQLEKTGHTALDQDTDGATVGGGTGWALLLSQPTANAGAGFVTGATATIDCDDATQSYCLGGSAS